MTGQTIADLMYAEAAKRTSMPLEVHNPSQPLQKLVLLLPRNGHRVEPLQAAAIKADGGKARGTNFSRALLAEFTTDIFWGDTKIEIDGRDPEASLFGDWAVRGWVRDKLVQEHEENPKETPAPPATLSPADAVFGLIKNDGDIIHMAETVMGLANYIHDPLD